MTRPFPKNVPEQPLYFQLVAILTDKKVEMVDRNFGYMTLVNLYPTVPPGAVWCMVLDIDRTYWVFNIHRVMRTRPDLFYLDKTALKFKDWNAAKAALQMEGA